MHNCSAEVRLTYASDRPATIDETYNMRQQSKVRRQPAPAEIQRLGSLIEAEQFAQAEVVARTLLTVYPDALVLHNALGVSLEGQNKFESAAASYRRALAIDPNIAEIRFNLAVVLTNLGMADEAIANYRKLITQAPGMAVAHFNLGTVWQARREFDEAVTSYRRAVGLEPRFFEAHCNLGAVLQQQGQLEEALASYLKALALRSDALLHFNIGTVLRMQGSLDEAAASYRNALALEPDYADAHNNLGEVLRDQGRMDEAIACYRNALAIDACHGQACYNMGEFLCLAGRHEEAIAYFETAQLWDARDRTLYCLYRSGKFEQFKSRLEQALSGPHTSPLLATLSTHYATNFGTPDPYGFCKSPLDFVYHGHLDELSVADSPLLRDLMRDIEQTEIAERKQGRLYYGIQSAGNLLKRPEASFQRLAALVRDKLADYRVRYASEDCMLIKAFPREFEFSSSWYVKMRKGGHLTSHIHEEGWISGVLYLALPPKNDNHEGSIEFGTHGDDYPRRHTNFPSRIVDQRVGDIVLFPSSLFHRTIPYDSDEDRICIAFDLKPAVTIAS